MEPQENENKFYDSFVESLDEKQRATLKYITDMRSSLDELRIETRLEDIAQRLYITSGELESKTFKDIINLIAKYKEKYEEFLSIKRFTKVNSKPRELERGKLNELHKNFINSLSSKEQVSLKFITEWGSSLNDFAKLYGQAAIAKRLYITPGPLENEIGQDKFKNIFTLVANYKKYLINNEIKEIENVTIRLEVPLWHQLPELYKFKKPTAEKNKNEEFYDSFVESLDEKQRATLKYITDMRSSLNELLTLEKELDIAQRLYITSGELESETFKDIINLITKYKQFLSTKKLRKVNSLTEVKIGKINSMRKEEIEEIKEVKELSRIYKQFISKLNSQDKKALSFITSKSCLLNELAELHGILEIAKYLHITQQLESVKFKDDLRDIFNLVAKYKKYLINNNIEQIGNSTIHLEAPLWQQLPNLYKDEKPTVEELEIQRKQRLQDESNKYDLKAKIYCEKKNQIKEGIGSLDEFLKNTLYDKNNIIYLQKGSIQKEKEDIVRSLAYPDSRLYILKDKYKDIKSNIFEHIYNSLHGVCFKDTIDFYKKDFYKKSILNKVKELDGLLKDFEKFEERQEYNKASKLIKEDVMKNTKRYKSLIEL